MHFDEERELKRFVVERLQGTGLATEILEGFAVKFDVEKQRIVPRAEPGSLGLILPRWRWVIRNDDLKVLDAMADGMKSAAAVGFFVHAATSTQLLSAGAGMLAVVARLIRQAVVKGATVDEEELRMLLLLAANPEGLLINEVVEILNRSESVSAEKVQQVLDRLAKHAVADGSTAAFVSVDGAGRWRAAGV
jgi:hypothetical protein